MKVLLIMLGALILFGAFIMPITGYGIGQGFKHKDKEWAPKVVLASVRTRMYLMQYSTARPSLEQFLSTFPKHPEQARIFFWLGLCNEKEKNVKVAREWYERFLTNWPQHEWNDQVRRRIANIDAGAY